MTVIAKQDRALLIGLLAAAAVASLGVFARPIRFLLDLTRDIELSSGVSLLPALLILTAVFAFHQRGKRQQAHAQAAAAEAGALVSQQRAKELSTLVGFGGELGRSLDLDAIRDVIMRYLPKLTGSDEAWVIRRVDGSWEMLSAVGQAGRGHIERSYRRIAESVFSGESDGAAMRRVNAQGHLCLPMIAAGHFIGVLGVPESGAPLADARLGVLSAASTLLGISIRNAELFREVRDSSVRDGLTGCFNRTYAIELIESELARSMRTNGVVSLIMFDIDHFKDINDRCGHLGGDAVLSAVGARLRESLRATDRRCRYGGEEFLVLLPDTPLEGAERVAQALREELTNLGVVWMGEEIPLTASFGVAASQPGEVDAQAIIARADTALYLAKEQGRNCVRSEAESAAA